MTLDSCFVQQAFYYEGKAIMSNEEFDNLKEELMWEGSSVVMLSTKQLYLVAGAVTNEFMLLLLYFYGLHWFKTGSDEQKFLEASMAYVSGKPIMNDQEYDNLKLRLKVRCFHFSLIRNFTIVCDTFINWRSLIIFS